MSFVLDCSVTMAWCFEDERTAVIDTDIDEAIERLARNDAFDLVVADSLEAQRAKLRERLAGCAPEALMRMFEVTAASVPLPVRRTELQSGVRLALVANPRDEHGAR